MKSITPFLRSAVQLTGIAAAGGGFIGCEFCSLFAFADVTRADPEFAPMLAIAEGLLCLAPVALTLGLASLRWRPRYIAVVSIVPGAIITYYWLAIGT